MSTVHQSRDYIPNQQGWRVDSLTGEAEFNPIVLTPRPATDKETD